MHFYLSYSFASFLWLCNNLCRKTPLPRCLAAKRRADGCTERTATPRRAERAWFCRVKMFFISELEHTIRVPPQLLDIPLPDAIKLELRKLFLDKVIKDLGLCVTLYDIQSIEGGFVFAGDGAPTYTVSFRLIMFRPFIGEVLVGKLKKSDKSGLYLSLGFFDDIHVPEHLLPEPTNFVESESLWLWNYEGAELFMDLDEDVRFRVSQIKYPPIPIEQDNDAKPFAPMEIIGDISASGLGLTSWWAEDENGDGDEDENEDGNGDENEDGNEDEDEDGNADENEEMQMKR